MIIPKLIAQKVKVQSENTSSQEHCVVRSSLEYGNEMWECNKTQVNISESVILRGARKIWDVLQELVMRLLEGTWVSLLKGAVGITLR